MANKQQINGKYTKNNKNITKKNKKYNIYIYNNIFLNGGLGGFVSPGEQAGHHREFVSPKEH